ncbi:Pirin-like protein [Seminavis robusta]|uniref:Pirin-like protein n=1 Tax=Seminavis robusta TaxID=568900 RepID=A0A9N8H4R5_9STRA|nr:Pirin-like protein [Seminavis robusta]|eukprot:Sro56_g032810.1 Pirin-like protein (350) ;mRNA; f:75269-76515
MSDPTASPILKSSLVAKATLDPFLYCVYHKDAYPAAKDDSMEAPRQGDGQDFNPVAPYRMYHGDRIAGFPKHPHRGFETITATVEGIIDHSDSFGNAGRYGNGDLQWMTAGKGVVHAEMFPLVNKETHNHVRFFQIWINLPACSKMVEPSFAMFWAPQVPKWSPEDGLARATIFYGDYLLGGDAATGERQRNPNTSPKDSWAFDPEHDVAVIHIVLESGGSIPIPAAHGGSAINRVFYIVDGSSSGLTLNGFRVKGKMITVDASVDLTISMSDSSSSVDMLMLQGKPIGEPVSQSGPFVMNTPEEVKQAEADYKATQFGEWPWPRRDMVFAQDKGRFSLLDGNETVPPT